MAEFGQGHKTIRAIRNPLATSFSSALNRLKIRRILRTLLAIPLQISQRGVKAQPGVIAPEGDGLKFRSWADLSRRRLGSRLRSGGR